MASNRDKKFPGRSYTLTTSPVTHEESQHNDEEVDEENKKGMEARPSVVNQPQVQGNISAVGGVVNLGVQDRVSVKNREKAVESTMEKQEMLEKSHRENKEYTSKKEGDGGSSRCSQL